MQQHGVSIAAIFDQKSTIAALEQYPIRPRGPRRVVEPGAAVGDCGPSTPRAAPRAYSGKFPASRPLSARLSTGDSHAAASRPQTARPATTNTVNPAASTAAASDEFPAAGGGSDPSPFDRFVALSARSPHDPFTQAEVESLVASVAAGLQEAFVAALKSTERQYERKLHRLYHVMRERGSGEQQLDFHSCMALADDAPPSCFEAPGSSVHGTAVHTVGAMSTRAGADSAAAAHALVRLEKQFARLAGKHEAQFSRIEHGLRDSTGRIKNSLGSLKRLEADHAHDLADSLAYDALGRLLAKHVEPSSDSPATAVNLTARAPTAPKEGQKYKTTGTVRRSTVVAPSEGQRKSIAAADGATGPPAERLVQLTTGDPWSFDDVRMTLERMATAADKVLQTTIDPVVAKEVVAARRRGLVKLLQRPTRALANLSAVALTHAVSDMTGELLVHPESGKYCFSIATQHDAPLLTIPSTRTDDSPSAPQWQRQGGTGKGWSVLGHSGTEGRHRRDSETSATNDIADFGIKLGVTPAPDSRHFPASASPEWSAGRRAAPLHGSEALYDEQRGPSGQDGADSPTVRVVRSSGSSPAARRRGMVDATTQAGGDIEGDEAVDRFGVSAVFAVSTVFAAGPSSSPAGVDPPSPHGSPAGPFAVPLHGSSASMLGARVMPATDSSSVAPSPNRVGNPTDCDDAAPPSPLRRRRASETSQASEVSHGSVLAGTSFRQRRQSSAAAAAVDPAPRRSASDFHLGRSGIRRKAIATRDVEVDATSCEQELLPTLMLREARITALNHRFNQLFFALSTAAGSLSVYTDGLEGDLTCRQCFGTLTEPHVLWPCGHSFCRGCIEQTMARQDDITGDRLYHCRDCGAVCYEGHAPNVSLQSIAARWNFKRRTVGEPTSTVDALRKTFDEIAAQDRTGAVAAFVRDANHPPLIDMSSSRY